MISINEQIKKSGGHPMKAMCVICGLTNAAYYRDDGVYVVPITSLRDWFFKIIMMIKMNLNEAYFFEEFLWQRVCNGIEEIFNIHLKQI